jgi:SAM-dependent methyltransferase
MLKRFAVACWSAVHWVGHRTLGVNPLIPKRVDGRPVEYGFISDEHLRDPRLDDRLVEELRAAGIEVREYRIDEKGYGDYLAKAPYPESYHGGGRRPEAPRTERSHFAEKSLEHYVSADLLEFTPDDVYIDIASRRSPFFRIARELWGVRTVYRQDLDFEPGLHGDTIGGDAGRLPLPDGSVSKATLHCSLEHFEGDSDRALFREMGRVLRPGGRLCILPFYLSREYTIHTDPVYALFFGRGLRFDPEARVRYCRWNNRHSRHYDVERLKTRVLPNLAGLTLTVLRVTNFRALDAGAYLRFVGLFEKRR